MVKNYPHALLFFYPINGIIYKMFSAEQIKTILNFILDSAKIIFGSLVVGIFAPNISGEIPWLTFLVGIIMTLMFLGIAMFLSDKVKNNSN